MSDREESCESCYFFELYDPDFGEGHCRRYPPQLSSPKLNASIASMKDLDDPDEIMDTASDISDDSSHFQWPVVSIASEDWCGEFKPR